ncbi:MAG: hypothetical protein JWQ70_182 [Aeromicrobium sp.]|nr:hypothetical protein [Aeromicrobium sp.]
MTAIDVVASNGSPIDGSSAVDPADLGLFDLRSVSLEDLVEHAALMHRTDRKYVTKIPTVRELIAALADTHQVLEIAGRRWTSYRTLYFDTPELEACRAHVQKRRRRWKARSRLYVEDGLCRIEVKTKDNRGGTQKVMGPSHPDRYGLLVGDELDFVTAHLGVEHPEVDPRTLTPAAEISYTRATLTDLNLGTRVTIDWNLHCRLEAGDVWLDPDYALIETKGPSTPSVADRALNRLGTHPRSFSKYAAAASIVQDNIADNDTRYLQGRVLHHVIVH